MRILKKIPNVNQIVKIIEEIAPKDLALPGDPVGLQCGEPEQPVRRLMMSLDATLRTVIQAARFKADLLFTHHPLLFEPVTPENILGPTGQTLTRALKEGLSIYSAHTNLDASPRGINDSLADLLDIREKRILQETGPGLYKLVVFVPPENLDKVRSSAFTAGAGQIGDYSRCSFTVEGDGTFLPGEGASPAVGQPGKSEKLREVRLEISVTEQTLGPVLSDLKRVHPYEEPAIDIYPLLSGTRDTGLGLSGVLPVRSTVGDVAEKLSLTLKAGPFRLIGKKSSKVRSVAVCAGSGASLLKAAVAAGAELYITGDMKYHDARNAEDAGINVLDVGHFAPERYGLVRFGKLLEKMFAVRGLAIETAYAKERDPFVTL